MSPMVAMIQPMALVGRLATSSPPTTAKAPNPAEHHALHVVDHCVFVPQAGTICEEVARASANDVQGRDQPPRYARNDEQRATTHTTDFLPLFSWPFSHSTNLQHYRLPNVTMTILWSESEPPRSTMKIGTFVLASSEFQKSHSSCEMKYGHRRK